MESLSQYDRPRENMIRVIEREAKDTYSYTGKRFFDERVMKAMEKVPRHEFVPEDMRDLAYINGPVSIGHGQTISQPYIVALMTALLSPQPDHKVLDVGTGSGYQAAILSRLVNTVYSVEIVSSLAEQAKSRFQALGYHNIKVNIDDGYAGWLDESPYDGIVVAAATPVIPIALVQQLNPGGIMVLPLGDPNKYQELITVNKTMQGEISTRSILPVSFVPMVGGDNS